MIYRLCKLGDIDSRELAGLGHQPHDTQWLGRTIRVTGAMTLVLERPQMHADMHIAYARSSWTHKIVGWSALFDFTSYGGDYCIGVFVHPEHRRNGIGSKLVSLLRSRHPNADAHMRPTVESGHTFAKHVGLPVRGPL